MKMLNLKAEKPLAVLIALGSAFVTCFVWSGTGTDPVNAPKLLALGVLAFGSLGILIRFGMESLWNSQRFFLLTIISFNFLAVISTIYSEAPFVQNLYGGYGRNTGLLTYFCLSIICLVASLLSTRRSIVIVSQAFMAAGILNIIYCIWVLSFGDPIPWNNTYKNILGLLGNPNFISSFLGMLFAASVALLLAPGFKKSFRYLSIALIIASTFLIYKTHSIQGIFVAMSASALVLFFKLRSLTSRKSLQLSYLMIIAISTLFVIAGILQKGPLSFIYKKSVSLRGSYWKAGINMGLDHPFTGVGLDTYGDWYRSARPPVALIDTPGPTVLSNAAHNVVIDIFSSGGWPLFIAYLTVMFFGLYSVVKLIKSRRQYDVIAVGLSSVWLGYQVQSIVSINQIGLAIWGWLITGLLVSYSRISNATQSESNNGTTYSKRHKGKFKTQVFSPQLIIGIGCAIGFVISVPPVSSDAKWYSASQSGNLLKFKAALNSDYFTPQNSPRLATAAMLLQDSNLLADAKENAYRSIKFNKNYFESYLVLYLNPSSTDTEKAMAMENMKRLDPNNPDVLHYK